MTTEIDRVEHQADVLANALAFRYDFDDGDELTKHYEREHEREMLSDLVATAERLLDPAYERDVANFIARLLRSCRGHLPPSAEPYLVALRTMIGEMQAPKAALEAALAALAAMDGHPLPLSVIRRTIGREHSRMLALAARVRGLHTRE